MHSVLEKRCLRRPEWSREADRICLIYMVYVTRACQGGVDSELDRLGLGPQCPNLPWKNLGLVDPWLPHTFIIGLSMQ